MMTSSWARMQARWRPVMLALVVAFTMVVVVSSGLASKPLGDVLVDVLLFVGPFLVVGCVILVRAGWHRIGWLLLGTGIAFAIGISDIPFLPPWYAAWTGSRLAGPVWPPSWPFTAAFACLAYTTVTFPSGRLPSRTGASVARTVAVALPVFVLFTVFVRVPGYENGVAVPFGLLPSWAHTVGGSGTLLLLLGGTVSLVVRYRRSAGEVRAQLAWVVSSLTLVAVAVAAAAAYLLVAGSGGDVLGVAVVIAYLSLPVAFMVAILRYRLYDIDRIISRTLTYALLTAGLAATYAGLVVGLQALLRPVSGGSDLAIVVTTLVVAALFLPARRRIQTAVDRRFNRRTYDAARTIDAFAARLREQVDLDTLRYELLTVVDETMRPARVSLWLREQGTQR